MNRVVLAVETFAISESVVYILNLHKSDANIWHKWNIDILTSDSDSGWKSESGNISYTICWYGFTHSDNGIDQNYQIR